MTERSDRRAPEAVSVNGVAVDVTGAPTPEFAVARELLRQRAVALGLLEAGAVGETVDQAIERLLEREVTTPEPTEDECRRHYDAHLDAYRSGDLVFVRHILFQITPGSRIELIRTKAEHTLGELAQASERFADCAREMSNCPSGQHGGNLGQIGRGDTVPEFEEALFGDGWIGILPRLVKTRFGFHVIAIDQRIDGEVLPFDLVRRRIVERLSAHVQETALRQYVQLLAGQAEISGVDLASAATPLVQ